MKNEGWRRLLLLLIATTPVLHVVPVRIEGAVGTPADLFAAVVAAAWIVHTTMNRSWTSLWIAALLPLWIGASGAWGHHAGYAVAKAAGVGTWGICALAIRDSDLQFESVLTAWRRGLIAVIAIGAAWVVLDVGLGLPWSGFYGRGASIGGAPRWTAPMPHPNLLGDYLVVSILLLGASGRLGRALGGSAMAVLAATLSTATAGLGIAVAAGWRRRTWPERVAGVGVATAVLAGVLWPLSLDIGVQLTTTGLRPAIWSSAWEAVEAAPLRGVGASPFLAEARDVDGSLRLWDAHSAPLSIWGQFGLIGFVLWFGFIAYVMRGRAGLKGPVRWALLAAGVHALTGATEEVRWTWLLLGVAGGVAHGDET